MLTPRNKEHTLSVQTGELLLEARGVTKIYEAEGKQKQSVRLPEAGRRFAEADVLEEKQIFRQQVLARVGMLRRSVEDLREDADHTVAEERYLNPLKEHWSSDEAWAQLETIIDWGRYDELFSYMEDRGVFRQDVEGEEA